MRLARTWLSSLTVASVLSASLLSACHQSTQQVRPDGPYPTGGESTAYQGAAPVEFLISALLALDGQDVAANLPSGFVVAAVGAGASRKGKRHGRRRDPR